MAELKAVTEPPAPKAATSRVPARIAVTVAGDSVSGSNPTSRSNTGSATKTLNTAVPTRMIVRFSRRLVSAAQITVPARKPIIVGKINVPIWSGESPQKWAFRWRPSDCWRPRSTK